MIRMTALLLGALAFAPLVPQGCPMSSTPTDVPPTSGDRPVLDVSASSDVDEAAVDTVVTLQATTDAVGMVHYAWLQTAGPGVAIQGSDQAAATFGAPSVENDTSLAFLVTAQDENGAVGQASVGVTILADPNYVPYDFVIDDDGSSGGSSLGGPTADAGPDLQAIPNDIVTLSAADSEGSSLSYNWRQVDGDDLTIQNATEETASVVAPGHKADGENEYRFRLRVTDSRGRTSTDEVILEVLDSKNVGQRVKIVTSMGDIIIELYEDDAPISTENFLNYVDSGFYSNTLFHRVIPGFVAQGGGFEPGLNKKDTEDPIELESDNGLKNDRGTVALARTNDPDSATSQFFVNLVDNDFLNYSPENPGYAVFGRVFQGMDVVDRIAVVPTESRSGFDDVPVVDVIIQSATRIDRLGE